MMSEVRRRYCIFECDALVTHDVPLHRFPNPNKRPDLFAAWIAVVGNKVRESDRTKIYNNKRICDHHFDPTFKTTGGRLIRSAIPTVNLNRVQQTINTFVETDHSYCCPRREPCHVGSMTGITNSPGSSSVQTKQALGPSRSGPSSAVDSTEFSGPSASTCLTSSEKCHARTPLTKFDADFTVFESSEIPSPSKFEKSSHNIQTDSLEKLQMCRICLAENVSMYVLVNKNLCELYEKLTDIPFVTEDSRPILACFFCCAQLKQCYRLQRKCLEAEQLFAQLINENYETSSLKNHLQFYNGFIKSPIVHISTLDDKCQMESIATQEELPAFCEGLDDIIEPKEEHQSDGATVAKKPKLHTRRTKLADAITAQQTKNDKSDSKIIRTTRKRTPKPGTAFKELHKCDQRSYNRVKRIIQLTHTKIGKEPFKCDVCQRSFSDESNLTRHIHTHTHTGEKPNKCDVCQRSFRCKASLTTHIRHHTGEKPYKCDVCQRSYSQKNHLKTHIRLHTGEKPYKCDVCQRRFSQKGSLKIHIRLHTGEKPYKCVVCQRSFSQKVHLKTHIRQHTGEKAYKCDVCLRSFSQKGNLKSHSRQHTVEKA